MKHISTNYHPFISYPPNKLRFFLVTLVMFTVVTTSLICQENSRIYRDYTTQKVQARLLSEDPEMTKEQEKIEKHIANFKLVGQIKEVTIPIIFHILYNESTERISEEQIQTQLVALNRDFTVNLLEEEVRHPADKAEKFSKHLPEKLGIQFCLADLRQGNQNQSAIQYTPTEVQAWADDDAIKIAEKGGVASIQPDKYLNIWIGNLEEGTSGYAQMPGGGEATDGIVIDYQFFGVMESEISPYNEGKTLTHLIGSYLGLYELWNEKVRCGDDLVDDTPIHNGANFGPVSHYKHVSLCGDNPTEMSMNFMDNSDDASLYLFTVGQMWRMQAILTNGGPRHQLVKTKAECTEIAEERLLENQLISLIFYSDHPKVTISPNPANSHLQIEIIGESENGALVIYNATGQLMYQQTSLTIVGQATIEIATNKWEAGIYFVHTFLNGQHQNYRLAIAK